MAPLLHFFFALYAYSLWLLWASPVVWMSTSSSFLFHLTHFGFYGLALQYGFSPQHHFVSTARQLVTQFSIDFYGKVFKNKLALFCSTCGHYKSAQFHTFVQTQLICRHLLVLRNKVEAIGLDIISLLQFVRSPS
jgi:hypothetical protein